PCRPNHPWNPGAASNKALAAHHVFDRSALPARENPRVFDRIVRDAIHLDQRARQLGTLALVEFATACERGSPNAVALDHHGFEQRFPLGARLRLVTRSDEVALELAFRPASSPNLFRPDKRRLALTQLEAGAAAVLDDLVCHVED